METLDPSAWRNFLKPRPLRRHRGRPRKRPTPALFYGYSAELIAEWCVVKLSTAYAYKSGRLKPGASVVKLLRLHAGRQVLTAEWQGWIVKPDCVVTPEGFEIRRTELRGLREMFAWAHSLAQRSGDPRDLERYWELLSAA